MTIYLSYLSNRKFERLGKYYDTLWIRWSSWPNSDRFIHIYNVIMSRPNMIRDRLSRHWLETVNTGCFITGCNEVVAKVMFLLVCVILFTGGMSASVHAGIPDTPPGADTPLGADTPREQTPPTKSRHSPTPEQTPGIRSMSGRYASYWNAFLFCM